MAPAAPQQPRRPDRELCPLLATFLMLPRSRGAIGRVRATPGALSAAGRRSDGSDGRVDGIPGQGKGLRPNMGEMQMLMKWGRLGEIWRKVLAFGHLEIV